MPPARGFDVVLVEAHDFGKGTSSRSTKLVHGGVRYLEQGNISLVMSALKERGLLRQNAPHLVHDLAFVVPNYSWWEAPFYGIGLKLYDLLAGKYGFGASKLLSKEETLERLPALEPEGLRGGVVYFDGQFDDSRLLIHLAMTAADHGATLLNYCPATSLLRDAEGYVNGLTARDEETGEVFTIPARIVVNATGVFTDSIRRMADPAAENAGRHQPGHSPRLRPLVPQGRYRDHGAAHQRWPRTVRHSMARATPWPAPPTRLSTRRSLEPRPLDEEIEFILETAARLSDPSAYPGRCASCLRGHAAAGQAGEGKDFGAVARSRHPRGHFRPAHHHRRQVDHLSAHGRGLRGPRHHAGQAARRALPHT